MSTPSEPDDPPGSGDPPSGEAPFDPYRFGRPDHPVPAEYAPPGYTGPTTPPGAPYGEAPGVANPYATPPAYPPGPPTPYAGGPGTPYQYPPLPPGYGAPPPPPFHGYAQPKTGNGKAIAALVLGILAVLLCWLSLIDLVPIILATVFGFLALGDARRHHVGGRGLAIAGLICTAVGTVLAVLLTVFYAHVASECSGTTGSDRDHCIRTHL